MVPTKVAADATPDTQKLGRPAALPPKVQPTILPRGQSLQSFVQWYIPPRRPYSRRELLADRFVNFLGAGLSWVGVALLMERSRAEGDPLQKQLGFLAHGFGLIVMLNCSALYHYLAWRWDWAHQLLSLDHVGISAMIVGCYVPVMLQIGCFGTLACVCCLGILGWIMEGVKLALGAQHFSDGAVNFQILDKLHIVRYLVMGWTCIVVIPYVSELPRQALVLMGVGGLLYSSGVVFFVSESMEFHLAVWHGAVLVASLCFYLANVIFLVGLPLAHTTH